MFKILGADGREYGPVAADQIKRWIAEGRANRETMVQVAGEPGWKPLGQYAEFADVLGAPPAAAGVPPPSSAVPASPAAAPAGVTQAGSGGLARARAEQMISGPAIALMVTAGLGLAFGLFNLTASLLYSGHEQLPPMPGVDPDMIRMIQKVAYGPVAVGVKLVFIGMSVLILLGAIRMQRLSSYGLAMTAAVIALVPCFFSCCGLGIPFGIWALMVLSKPEVKSQFH